MNFLDSFGYVKARALVLGTNTIASAATIGPTYGITHITGTIAVTTITVPSSAAGGSSFTGCMKLIADNGFSTTTGGNIAAAYTLAAGKMYDACFDGTKWYMMGSGL